MHKKGLISFGIIIFGILVYRFFTNPYNLNSRSFKEIYKPGGDEDIGFYVKTCSEEIKNDLYFPLGKVEKAIVCNGFFSIDRTIEKGNISKILQILNDTSSYIWGEIVTFIPGKKIVFYDKENKALGITHIDAEGQFTYSYPHLKRMKWGTLTFEADRELQNLIDD